MKPRRPLVRLLALAVAAVLIAGVAPASARPLRRARVNDAPALPGAPATPVTPPNAPVPLAGDRGPVPAGVRVAGRDIGGLTESEARAVIHAFVRPDALPPLDLTADGRKFTLTAGAAFDVDTRAMLDQAYAATGPTDLPARWVVDTRAARAFLNGVARAVDRTAGDARWSVSGKRLKYTAHVTGRRMDGSAARRGVLSALAAEARTGAAQPAVGVAVASIQPRWTDKNLGRAILVVIGERTLRLYEKADIKKTYKCAVGMPGYPTPTGDFHIVEKRYMPTWVNPGSAWGKGMPAVIGPGPGNPLGTRALNLDSPGIRIHGTENIGSVGTAASHGCMRLVRGDIEELYNLVSVGTPVFIVP